MPVAYAEGDQVNVSRGEDAGLSGVILGPYGSAWVVDLGGRTKMIKGSDLHRVAPAVPKVKRPKGTTNQEWMNELCPGCGFKRAQCSCLELHLLRDIRAACLPEPVRQFRFSPRKYQTDFAWPDLGILVEVEGGGQRGHHQTHTGYEYDCRKYNLAARFGFRILRYTGAMIKSGEALNELEEVLGCRSER